MYLADNNKQKQQQQFKQNFKQEHVSKIENKIHIICILYYNILVALSRGISNVNDGKNVTIHVHI